MRGPYTYTLTHGNDELDTDTPPGVLKTVERFAALRAYEWVESGCVSDAVAEIHDANGNLVRVLSIYRATKGQHKGLVVSERLS